MQVITLMNMFLYIYLLPCILSRVMCVEEKISNVNFFFFVYLQAALQNSLNDTSLSNLDTSEASATMGTESSFTGNQSGLSLTDHPLNCKYFRSVLFFCFFLIVLNQFLNKIILDCTCSNLAELTHSSCLFFT